MAKPRRAYRLTICHMIPPRLRQAIGCNSDGKAMRDEHRWANSVLGGATLTGTFNALGQRMRKYTSAGASSVILFVYDQQGQLLGEYNSTGAALREYIWLGNTPVAMFTPAGPGNPPNMYFIHTDHIDTPRVVVERNGGAVRWMWLSEAFGSSAAEDNPTGLGAFTLPLRFPGQYFDLETGTHYNYFRDYDPWAGRYLQSDPIGLAGGLNTYGYVEAAPTMAIDPLGLATEMCRRKLNNVPFSFGPLYHQYVCVPDGKGGKTCGGLGPTGKMFDSPGKIEYEQSTVGSTCEKVEDDNSCVERCIAAQFDKKPPNYSVDLSKGTNCQSWANDALATCKAQCRFKK